jgi:cystathionine gamma-synthase
MASPRAFPETLCLHHGTPTPVPGAPLSPSLTLSTSFHTAPGAVGFSATDLTDTEPNFYGRWGHPASTLLETRLAALEHGAGAVCYASGMAAITALFLSRLAAGGHLLLSDVCYAGVAELAHQTLPRFGIRVTQVDTANPRDVADAILPGATKLLHIETPANPTLKLSDIAALSTIAHDAGIELSVDSTIATPLATKPLALGADYVVHSLTKYICGHGDALGGAVIVADPARLPELRQGALIHQGATLNPFAAWLITRGLETLPARMRMHEANARAVADFLGQHPKIAEIYWPGSPRHPQSALARQQMENFSGLLAFTTTTDAAALARQLAARLRVFAYAVSLGKTKSLLFHIPTDDILRTSFHLPPQGQRAYRSWAKDGIFRVSVGLEHPEDLIADLRQALDAA